MAQISDRAVSKNPEDNMKKLKSMALISLASLFVFNNVQAETKQPAQKQSTQKQSTQKQAAQKQTAKQQKQANSKNAKPAQTELSQEEVLKRFNQAFDIQLQGYRVAKDASGKTFLMLKYEFTNKGKKTIRSVEFVAALLHMQSNQIIFAENLPLTFNNGLKPKAKVNLEVSSPFEQLPEISRQLLLEPNAKLSGLNGAKSLVFSDNTGLLLK